MLNISHAKKAQDLATETNYRTSLHEYTTLPTDINVAWAKKAYGLQSDVSLLAKSKDNNNNLFECQNDSFNLCFRNCTGRI